MFSIKNNRLSDMREKTILLVEDNSDDELLTIRALKKNNILNEIVVARDGLEALNYLYARGEYADRDVSDLPQVVLLDLKLPKIDGLEALQIIRKEESTKYLPVVVLTSSSEEEDIVKSYELGANSFIRKPVNFNDFVEAVGRLGMYWILLNQAPGKM
jgi:two-component system response regulator